MGERRHFGWAFSYLWSDMKVRVAGWPKGWFVAVQTPDANSANTGRYLYLVTPEGRNPWTPGAADLFNENWEVLEDAPPKENVL